MNQKKIKCLVVDDESPAIEVLRQYIESTPSLVFAGACHHALAALEFLRHETVDLIFLDIQMPQLKGTDFIKTIPNPPRIIFTTAFRDYAMDGFELGAVDFLLKPISFDRFLKAVNKIQTGVKEEDNNLYQVSERFLYFRADRKMVKVMLRDILYIESLKDYVKITTTKGPVVTKQSISSVEDMLPDDDFIRIHRSFIVSIKKIDCFTASDITVGKAELPVGPLYRHEITRRMQVTL